MKRPARVLWEKSLGSENLPLEVQLPSSDAHHLCRVMRLKNGAAVDLLDSTGERYRGELKLGSSGANLLLRERLAPLAGDGVDCAITVFQAPPKVGKLDPFLRAMAEAGARHLIPIKTARTVVPLHTPGFQKICSRWQKIALESCKQSGRTKPLTIAAPLDYQAALAQGAQFDRAFFLQPGSGSGPLEITGEARRIALLIRPEGGLTAAEAAQALAKGWQALEINPAILRCETAGLVAIGILQFVLNYGCKTP